MHGLEQTYKGVIAVERRNAGTPDGRRALDAYDLRGHPGLVLAAADGSALWSWTGPIEAEAMEAVIEEALAERSD